MTDTMTIVLCASLGCICACMLIIALCLLRIAFFVGQKMENENKWDHFGGGNWRMKVGGGHLYQYLDDTGVAMCFVPDVDLQRYQAHLRDAYNQGFKDGLNEAQHQGTLANGNLQKKTCAYRGI